MHRVVGRRTAHASIPYYGSGLTRTNVIQATAKNRCLVTLAIETSCDDTSVAVLEKHDTTQKVRVHYHAKVTADNLAWRGVHPLYSQVSHEENVALLVASAIERLPVPAARKDRDAAAAPKPDFVTVTRGPGMRASLNAGLNTAKGLAVAWNVPLVAVNHMQAHALTPRLVHAMEHSTSASSSSSPSTSQDTSLDTTPAIPAAAPLTPGFPFLTLLVSGGHTLLLRSESLTAHPILAETSDIAVGDAIDKIARDILPADVLAGSENTMYGPLLERFAFDSGSDSAVSSGDGTKMRHDGYVPPTTLKEEMRPRSAKWGWALTPTFAETKGGAKRKTMEFSFSGVGAAVKRVMAEAEEREIGHEERRALAREAMRLMFEHLASRVVLGLEGMQSREPKHKEKKGFSAGDNKAIGVDTLVVSGGVAANEYLRHILRKFLDIRGYQHIGLEFPPLDLCTDNAVMIGWTGFEMFEASWASELSCRVLRKWSLDPAAEDGGIMGASGWRKLDDSTVADM